MRPPIETHLFADDGTIPNNPFLPLLIYRGVLPPGRADPAARLRRRFARHGWTASWRDGIYDFHHFHSTAHEVLGIAGGAAHVRLGGPGGLTTGLAAGDVVVIPAGVGHKCIKADPGFLVVGAYAGGRAWDIRLGLPAERHEVLANIRNVPLPGGDPVEGDRGALCQFWRPA